MTKPLPDAMNPVADKTICDELERRLGYVAEYLRNGLMPPPAEDGMEWVITPEPDVRVELPGKPDRTNIPWTRVRVHRATVFFAQEPVCLAVLCPRPGAATRIVSETHAPAVRRVYEAAKEFGSAIVAKKNARTFMDECGLLPYVVGRDGKTPIEPVSRAGVRVPILSKPPPDISIMPCEGDGGASLPVPHTDPVTDTKAIWTCVEDARRLLTALSKVVPCDDDVPVTTEGKTLMREAVHLANTIGWIMPAGWTRERW